jgi:hypothetical protein
VGPLVHANALHCHVKYDASKLFRKEDNSGFSYLCIMSNSLLSFSASFL